MAARCSINDRRASRGTGFAVYAIESKNVAIRSPFRPTVQMNTTTAQAKKVARVAIDVRLYFDVPIANDNEEDIRQAAYEELERVEEGGRIRTKKLRFPNIYLMEEWSDLLPGDFDVCQRCNSNEANSDTRFLL